MLTIDDLRPKEFTINVKGVELRCKPPRLSHVLTISKVGQVFQEPEKATADAIKQAEIDMDSVIGELIPDLKGVQVDVSATLEIITQLMEQVQPTDNKELADKKVQFDTDPKVQGIG